MKRLDTAQMATIVSQVTQPVLGLSFQAASQPVAQVGPEWKAASLPIAGGTPLTVAVAADDACCRALGSTMFGTPPEAVDQTMVEDALCELVNMTAGLLKSAMHVDQALGLPAIREPEILRGAEGAWSQHFLRAGQLNLVLAVATRIW